MLVGPSLFGLARLVSLVVGSVVAVVGATFLFGGLVGALFKLVADANILAESGDGDRS